MPNANSLKRLAVWDKPECAGGTQQYVIGGRQGTVAGVPALRRLDLVSCHLTYDLRFSDTLTFVVRHDATSAAASLFPRAAIVRHTTRDGAFTEWRVDETVRALGQDGDARLTVVARTLALDLADVPLWYRLATGHVYHDVTLSHVTMAEVWDTYLQPRLDAEGYAWITRGDFEDDARYDIAWTAGATVLSVMHQLLALPPRGAVEMRVRRNGTTDYRTDVLVEVGETATPVDVRYRKNLIDIQRTDAAAHGADAILPLGDRQSDGTYGTLARAVWRITAIFPGTNEVVLQDPGPDPAPVWKNNPIGATGIAEGYVPNDQLAGLVLVTHGGVAQRAYAVTGSTPASGRVALADVGGLAVDDLAFFARTAHAARTYPDPFVSTHAVPVGLSNVIGGGTRELTLTDPFATVDPLPTADRWKGLWISTGPNVLVTTSTAHNATTQEYTLASVTGLQVGDVGVRCTLQTGTDLGALKPAFTIVAIDAPNLRVTVAPRYTTAAIILAGDSDTGYWHFYRLTAGTGAIESVDASANTMVVSSVLGMNVGHWAECWHTASWDELADFRNSYTQAAPKANTLTIDGGRGEANLIPNGHFENWTGDEDTNPDWLFQPRVFSYDIARYRATRLRVTTPGLAVLGGKALDIRRVRYANLNANVAIGATSFDVTPFDAPTGAPWDVPVDVKFVSDGTNEIVSVISRADLGGGVWRYSISGTFAQAHTAGVASCLEHGTAEWAQRFVVPPSGVFTVYARLRIDGPADTSLNTVKLRVTRSDGTTVDSTTVDAVGVYQQRGIVGVIDTPGKIARVDVLPIFDTSASASFAYHVYVDALAVVPVPYQPPVYPAFSFGTHLWHSAQAALAARAWTVFPTINLRLVDLHRMDGTAWPDHALTIGGRLSVTFPDAFLFDRQLRVVEIRADSLIEGKTEVTLAEPATRISWTLPT